MDGPADFSSRVSGSNFGSESSACAPPATAEVIRAVHAEDSLCLRPGLSMIAAPAADSPAPPRPPQRNG